MILTGGEHLRTDGWIRCTTNDLNSVFFFWKRSYNSFTPKKKKKITINHLLIWMLIYFYFFILFILIFLTMLITSPKLRVVIG